MFVITFATQEVLLFRNVKTGEIAVGAEDRVEQCHYAAVITRVEEELDNELTGGWKIVEVRLALRSMVHEVHAWFSCRWDEDLLASISRSVNPPRLRSCRRPKVARSLSWTTTHTIYD